MAKRMSVSELMEDLAGVSKWHSLGTHLGLEPRQLDVIQQEIPAGVDAIQRRKGRVLDTWMKGKTGNPSWRDVVSALMKMGEHSIAEEMRRKYSGSVSVSKAVAIARENQQQITREFIKLQMLVCEKLQTMKINMQQFLYFIKGLFQCADFIPAPKKINKIFEAITHHGLWDFINYSPLRQIVEAFAKNDEEVNTAIHKYQCKLAGYLAGTKIADHIASMNPISVEVLDEDEPSCARKDKRYFNKLSIKLEANVTEESLDYLIELWGNLSSYLCLPSLTYLLDEIHEGCVSVVFLIPPSAMPALTLKINDPETAKFFFKLGIIQMEVDDLCLFKEQEQSVKTATEQDSSLEQFPDSQEQVEKEAIEGISKETAEQEQDSTSEELPQQDKEGDRWREQLEALQKTVNIEKKFCKPAPQNCKAVGRGLQYGETNQIAEFQVHLTDANGEPCVERQEVRAELKSLVDGRIIRAEVSHQTRSVGSYSVSYQPSIRGRHELSVLVNDVAIRGSPFRVYIQQPPQLMGQPVRVIRGLKEPYRATLSSDGQLIVTENCVIAEHGRISVFDGQGGLVHRIDSLRPWYSSRVQLYPTGVAIDDSGMMYVCDGNAHKLFKVSSTGKVLKSVGGKGSGPRQFDYPDGIALRDNRLYICDRLNHRIQIFSCDLNFIGSFGSHGRGEGEFYCPRDIALDQEGNMYVVEDGNLRVQVFSPSGTFLRAFDKYDKGSGELSGPRGIHVDHNIVYITDLFNHCIFTFTTSGEFITSFSSNGSEKEKFRPFGITMDYDGFLYVCDSANNRVQVF